MPRFAFIWLFATYIRSEDNKVADQESRALPTETEWELNQSSFEEIIRSCGRPDIDLFASNINKKCNIYISWLPDPNSLTIDAFSVCWKNYNFYAFPPFSLILRTLKKIITDQAEGIVVVPNWCTQPWYPLFCKLLIGLPVVLHPDPNLLLSPSRETHPLAKKITLVAGKLSGKLS